MMLSLMPVASEGGRQVMKGQSASARWSGPQCWRKANTEKGAGVLGFNGVRRVSNGCAEKVTFAET